MSTKSLAWGLFGGVPSVRSETKEAPGHAAPRRAIVMDRPGAARSRSLTRSRPLALLRGETRTKLAIALAVGVVLLSLAYIFGINQSAAKGYEVTAQKNKLNTLIEDNKKLLVRTAQAGSVSQIQDDASANQLVQITAQEYLQQPTQLTQR